MKFFALPSGSGPRLKSRPVAEISSLSGLGSRSHFGPSVTFGRSEILQLQVAKRALASKEPLATTTDSDRYFRVAVKSKFTS